MGKAECILALVLLLGTMPNLAFAKQTQAQPKTKAAGIHCQDVVLAMEKLVAGLQAPEYLANPEAEKKGNEFDPGQYFKVLTELSLTGQQVLDYVYRRTGSAGSPVFYLRPRERKPYRNLKEYERLEKVYAGAVEDVWNDITQAVQAEDTETGYFEWVVFYLKAPHFYLQKNAATDYRLVCDQKQLQENLRDTPDISKDAAAQARLLDPAPWVRMSEETVEVRVVSFTKWGGFYEEIFLLARKFPHKIIRHNKICLAEYNCGIIF